MKEDENTAADLSTVDKKTGDEDSAENVTERRLARCEEGIGVLAQELLNVKSLPLEGGRLIRGMDARLKLLTKLVDLLCDALEKHGMMQRRPKGATDVN